MSGLTWADHDATTDGRWSINSEHIRGEPRWYWLNGPSWASPLCDTLPRKNGMGGWSRREMRALAERLERLHERVGAA